MTDSEGWHEDDLIDAGLGAAFRGASEPPTVAADRYEISGELGRGGMGIVLRARDRAFSRLVAIKVLKPSCDQPELRLERFEREARTTGQLQHPSIIPVYDRGALDDGRPFFAMRLVEGRTMAAALQEWKRDSGQRWKLLPALLRVAEAVAYAHDQGFVHRDLKPSNILLGPFGEVIVADWGLARPLGDIGPADVATSPGTLEDSSSTQTGTVLGTPAYMPSEQARGEVHRIGPWSDVHALGVMLLEIVTGSVKGPGDPPTLEDLSAHGADESLAQLILESMSPEPARRPSNAKSFSDRLARWMSARDERARRAELEAAEAQARAADERRVRRLVLTVAALIVFSLAGAVAAFVWNRAQRDRRVQQATAQVAKAWDLARRDKERALLLGTVLAFREAQASALSALAFAESEDVPAEWRVTLETSGREVSAALDAAIAKERERERDSRFLETLQSIGTSPLGARSTEATDALYEQAFRGYDFGDGDFAPTPGATPAAPAAISDIPLLAALHADPQGLSRLSSREVRERIRFSVLDWASARNRVAEVEGGGALAPSAGELFDLVTRLEPTEKGRRFLENCRDVLTLENLRGIGVEELSAHSPAALRAAGSSLLAMVSPQAALDFLNRACVARPGDFHLELLRGVVAFQMGGPQLEVAVRATSAALAAQPSNANAHVSLAVALRAMGVRDEARFLLERAVAIDPSHAFAHYNLSVDSLGRRDYDGTEAALERVIALNERFAEAYANLGLVYDKTERPAEAHAVYRKALRLHPYLVPPLLNLALLEARKANRLESLLLMERFQRHERPVAQVHRITATLLMDLGRPHAAEAQLAQIAAKDAQPERDAAQRTRAAALRATLEARADDYPDGVVTDGPMEALGLVEALLARGRRGAALELLVRSIELHPRDLMDQRPLLASLCLAEAAADPARAGVLRDQARKALAADIDGFRTWFESPWTERDWQAPELARWRRDPNLSAMRKPALDAWPETDARAMYREWRRVAFEEARLAMARN